MTETYYHNAFKICTEVPQEAVQAVDQINIIQCTKCGKSLD